MKKVSQDNINNVKKKLEEASKLSVDKLFKKYKTSINGISVIDVENRIDTFGKNIIDIKEQKTIWHRLKEAFINPFNIVLTIVAIITFISFIFHLIIFKNIV